jgi:hypothetical protein
MFAYTESRCCASDSELYIHEKECVVSAMVVMTLA